MARFMTEPVEQALFLRKCFASQDYKVRPLYFSLPDSGASDLCLTQID